MEEAMAKSDLPTVVAVAINSKGHRIEYAYGAVNWGESEPIKTSSIFWIHSMTKIVTSIATMQLVEQGKVELDQDLSELRLRQPLENQNAKLRTKNGQW